MSRIPTPERKAPRNSPYDYGYVPIATRRHEIDGPGLKKLREERGMSPRSLAREAGITEAYLVGIESGELKPSNLTIDKIMRGMGL